VPPPSLILQTTYAELLDRFREAAFRDAFGEDGSFVSKSIKGKRYWYFQTNGEGGRRQKYVGPESPDLQERIARHRLARDDERERRALVSTLVRSFGLPRPTKEIGDIVEALANAGVFRLPGVLVGTVAYQVYPAMLGARLSQAILQTGDVDIAQFQSGSIAVEDQITPVLDLLRSVDQSFRPVPHIRENAVTSYTAAGGLRVDFLTPNEGRDSDVPKPLRALQTEAEPLRFLDFLIYDPEPAVLLHNSGVCINVPSPQRFAIHKLIVSRRRRQGDAKQDKDIRQSAALLDILCKKRPYETRSAWQEAYGRGRTWQKLLTEGVNSLPPETRDKLREVVGRSL